MQNSERQPVQPVGRRCRAAALQGRAATRPYRNALDVFGRSAHASRVTRHASAFTLIELLMVIVILGIMAGLTLPVIKNFGKSDATLSAARQMLDDVGRARQMAISQRTTVYMVFVPTNFWAMAGPWPTSPWWTSLSAAVQTAATNLCDKQLTGYTFMANGAMGDQPGNHQWHYLARWQNLPDGTFIALAKFTNSSLQNYTITDLSDPSKPPYPINGFATNAVPFPTATNLPVLLPCLAFNYLGQLVSDVDSSGNYRDAYIPLAKGSVLPARDPVSKAMLLSAPQISETPSGNSTNSSYNIIHIDRLTGRSVLEYQKLK